MNELSFEYLHTMSSQVILICTFLAGFSATILSSFVTQKQHSRIRNVIILSLLIATCTMLISMFYLTNIFILTTPGYPQKVSIEALSQQLTICMIFFVFGIAAFLLFISLTGWLNSRNMGMVTSVLGAVTFIFVLSILS